MDRYDLLTPVHKGIRALICHLTLDLQRADLTDPAELAAMRERVLHDLELLYSHSLDEENVLFPQVGRFELELVALLHKEHEEIEARMLEVKEALDVLEAAQDPEAAQRAGASFIREVNALAAFYLTHMNQEEGTLLPVTWQYFTNAELAAIRTEIQQSMPPERYREWMHWILSALNTGELTGLLRGMRTTAPAEIFERTVAMARQVLGDERWAGVAERAGLP